MKRKIIIKNIIKTLSIFVFLLIIYPNFILAEELDLTETEMIATSTEEFMSETTATSTETTNNEIETIATTTTEENFDVEEEISTSTEEISTFTEETSSTTEEFLLENENSTSTITVNLNLRYQDSLIFSGPITLLKDVTTTIIDNTETNREIISSTALGALHQADENNNNFNLSDLAYYASWNAFLINCIEVATSSETSYVNTCYNWQYVVNDTYPFVGADQYVLSEGDNIYFYFGSPRIVELATSTIFVGESVVATVKSYDYQNNVYVPAPNYTIGLTQPDPNNPWSPTVLFSTTSDLLGQGILTVNQIGSYGVGIQEDYYSILKNLLVVATTSETTTSATSTETTGSTGGSNNVDSDINISKAIDFLIANQSSNGSFGNDLYTDWAAIGLAASGNSSAKNLIKNYLISKNFSGDTLTDYERHAIALMSLGINPYTGTNQNYIQKIIDEFDGKQFGDEDLVNDDIFALFPLLKAGYNYSDLEISKTVEFIISKQSSNGSWESVDLTAAAIQALSLVTDLSKVNTALEKAKTYLKNSQQNDGGFGNTFSTSWVIQAIKALGEDQSDWIKNSNTPEHYLASKQNTDGGLEYGLSSDTRVWATAYLIPAYYGKTWNSLMSNFKKPKIEKDSISSSNNSNISSNEIIEESSEQIILSEDFALPFPVDQSNLITENYLLDEVSNIQDESEQVQEENLDISSEKLSQNNLQANVLSATLNWPVLKTFNSFVSTTLAGFGLMWDFMVTLFKI